MDCSWGKKGGELEVWTAEMENSRCKVEVKVLLGYIPTQLVTPNPWLVTQRILKMR